MAFFPHAIHNSPASFTPLFRLLEDFDKYSQQSGNSRNSNRRAPVPTWQPRFDVRETEAAYELHGELPGLSKENVSIEFSDPQTLIIRGKTERTYTAGTPPSKSIEGATEQPAITEERRNSHQATVEDEEAEGRNTDWSVVDKPNAEKTPEKPVDNAKFWLTERSIGEFSRSFDFPTRVDQESVSASLKDGILTVVVPKAKKYESRSIAIN